MAIVIALPCAASCSDPIPEVFPILNKAQTENGEPLSGLEIREGDKSRGQTDETGVLFLQIRGFVGQKVALTGVCPQGYQPFITSRTIALQHLTRLDNERIASGPEVSWRCSLVVRRTALVIRAPAQPNLPVSVRGQRVGQTTTDGVAHFLLKESTGSRFFVTLHTSEYPDLRPQNPQRLFIVKERDAILIFDQQFTKTPKKKKRCKSKPTPQRHVPYKIAD